MLEYTTRTFKIGTDFKRQLKNGYREKTRHWATGGRHTTKHNKLVMLVN